MNKTLQQIAQTLTGIEFSDLTTAERRIAAILVESKICDWHTNKHEEKHLRLIRKRS